MFDNIECEICNEIYNNSSGLIIQRNSDTGIMTCMDCAMEQWELEKELSGKVFDNGVVDAPFN